MNKNIALAICLSVILAATMPALVLAMVTPPRVLTYPAVNIGQSSATLKGEVTSDGECAELKLWFELGTDTSYNIVKTPVIERTTIGPFLTVINGLSPCTVYHYRAVADNNGHRPGYGQDVAFTTNCPVLPVIVPSDTTSTTAPSTTIPATQVSTGVGVGTGILNSILLPLGIAFLVVWFFRSKIVGVDRWVGQRKAVVGEYRARKELTKRVKQARAD